MSEKKRFYRELCKNVNRILGRRAVTVDRIVRYVAEAKRIRRTKGTMDLIHFLTTLRERLFTPEEVKRLKQSSQYKEFSSRLLDLMVYEGVITVGESRMLKRMVF
ncbi:hypothetical protein [Melghirimyces algeriensis]|uniref:Uncharacterized protein n=1 Tax=Melghirimyces algeriensis TaxID=910412 RepID=A0A521BIS2_9BACL|nr:hypothetical protein [Melghirimyces algeriensis]SMO46580.1 hypothetical protein SAMN06264849_102110 [Melghirimyces algeriensis]